MSWWLLLLMMILSMVVSLWYEMMAKRVCGLSLRLALKVGLRLADGCIFMLIRLQCLHSRQMRSHRCVEGFSLRLIFIHCQSARGAT